MTLQLRDLPFYVSVAIYLAVIYNLYFWALEYSFSFEYLPWLITGCIAATAILFLMLNIIMRPGMSFLGLSLAKNNLNPPAPFSRHIYLFRMYNLVFIIQLIFVWNKFQEVWDEKGFTVVFIMPVIYSLVLAYITFIYMNRLEPLILMNERSRF